MEQFQERQIGQD